MRLVRCTGCRGERDIRSGEWHSTLNCIRHTDLIQLSRASSGKAFRLSIPARAQEG